MLERPWHITKHAIDGFIRIRRWNNSEDAFQRALAELEELSEEAKYKQTARDGRELWRCPPSAGGGLRWVLAPAQYKDDLPSVVWVGQGRPPETLWNEETAVRQCPHLPSTGEVYRVAIQRAGTSRERSGEVWEALVCSRCFQRIKVLE